MIFGSNVFGRPTSLGGDVPGPRTNDDRPSVRKARDRADEQTRRVGFPAGLVEEALALVPRTLRLAGREPACDLGLHGTTGYLAAGTGTWGFKGAPIFGLALAQEIATGRARPLVAPFYRAVRRGCDGAGRRLRRHPLRGAPSRIPVLDLTTGERERERESRRGSRAPAYGVGEGGESWTAPGSAEVMMSAGRRETVNGERRS